MLLAATPTAWGAFLDSGTGTPANPYRICSPDDLAEFASEVSWGNTFHGRYVVLGADIDMSLADDFRPVGSCGDDAETSASFEGHFDGMFHTISGLAVIGDDTDQAVGLFASIDGGGSVCNLRIAPDSYVSGYANVGTIAGKVWDGDIFFCGTDGHTSGETRVGALVGDIKSGQVYGCFNHGTVEASQTGAGGIIGRADGNVAVNGCYNTGTITSRRPGACGGIAAMAYSAVDFTACYNSGVINGKYSEAFEITPAPIVSDIPELIWTGTLEGCCYSPSTQAWTQPGAREFSIQQLASHTAVDYLNEYLPAFDGAQTILTYPFDDTVYTLPPNGYNHGMPILGWELRGYVSIDEIDNGQLPQLEIRGSMVRAADGSVIGAYAPTGQLVDRGISLTLPQGFYIIEGQKVLIR